MNIITINLPVFSLEEYIECDCKDIQERNNFDFLYEVFGGSLHNLRAAYYMDEISPYPDETYIIIKNQMELYFGNYKVMNISKSLWEKTARFLAFELFYPITGVQTTTYRIINTIIYSTLIHKTLSTTSNTTTITTTTNTMKNNENHEIWEEIPASGFMKNLLVNIWKNEEYTIMSAYKDNIQDFNINWLNKHNITLNLEENKKIKSSKKRKYFDD